MRILVRGFVLLLFCFTKCGMDDMHAQISLTPKRVVIQASSKAGELRVSNGSGVVQEIKVTSEFGYPVFDRYGEMTFRNGLAGPGVAISTKNWVEDAALDSVLSIFPRQFLLDPGSTQVVRLFVDRRFDPPEGLYWSRIRIESYEHNTEPQTELATSGVGTRVAFRVHQSLPVYYQHGSVKTKVDLVEQVIESTDEQVFLRTLFRRGGNSPFMGKVTTRISGPMVDTPLEITQTFYCYTEDWLVTELPNEFEPTEAWEIGYRFTPSIFDRRTGEMIPTDLFEVRQTLNPEQE